MSVTDRHHEEVVELCQSLRLHSTRANRNLSTSDLKGLGRGRVPIRGEGPLNSSMDGSTMRAVFAATRGTSTPFALPAGHGARLASIAASPPPGQRAERGTVDAAAPPIQFAVGRGRVEIVVTSKHTTLFGGFNEVRG